MRNIKGDNQMISEQTGQALGFLSQCARDLAASLPPSAQSALMQAATQAMVQIESELSIPRVKPPRKPRTPQVPQA